MAYTRQYWVDYPNETTPITAERLNHIEEGIEEAAKTGGGESDKVGVIKLFGGSNAPDGWLLCDGSAISRTTYSDLFEVIGTAYGEGDGSTTFNLPNIKGKTVVGLDSSDTDFNILGKAGGEKTHILTINEMPSHTHKPSSSQYGQFTVHSTQTSYGTADLAAGSQSYNAYVNETQATGGGQAHNNLQPYIVLNYIIKASGTAILKGNVVDSLDGDSTTNAPSIRAVNDRQRGFAQYLGRDSITITPTVDVYANVEAVKSMWGYGGTEVGLKINTPSGATLISNYTTRTNGHDTIGVPCLANYQYLLPAGGTYTFAMSTDGSQGGSMGNYIKASTIPKID